MAILPLHLTNWVLSLFGTVWYTSTAWQPDYVLRVDLADIHGDCHPRTSVIINGTSPGPLLTFEEGEHYWVRVYNDMSDRNTTIHFHGFTLYTTPFSDGTPMVSGWPIGPGAYFDYEIQLEEGFHGTFWYHSHVGMQLSTAQGPVIVHPRNKTAPVDYDDEIVMMIGDYYHMDDNTLSRNILSTTDYAWMSEPQTVLVNGDGYNPCDLSALKPGQLCSKDCGNHLQLVRPGTRYRVRVIAASLLSYYALSLESHSMVLFEADGTFVEPTRIDHLEIQSGQRYSILIETRDSMTQTDFQWYIQTMWRPRSSTGAATWRYDLEHTPVAYNPARSHVPGPPAQPEVPHSYVSEHFGWVSDDLREWESYASPPSDSEVDLTITLHGQQLVHGVGWRWAVNDEIDDEERRHVPFLVQLYEQDERPTPDYQTAAVRNNYDPSSDAYLVKLGDVVDIVIQNHPAERSGVVEAHPWHVHGAKYWDMGGGIGKFSYRALQRVRSHAIGSPIRRDTSVVYPGPGQVWNTTFPERRDLDQYPGGWRVLRFRAENPGAWLVHCHITPHAVMGMQTLFVVGAEHIPRLRSETLNHYLTFGAHPEVDHLGEPTRWFPSINRTGHEFR